jgi:hypothetical protein
MTKLQLDSDQGIFVAEVHVHVYRLCVEHFQTFLFRALFFLVEFSDFKIYIERKNQMSPHARLGVGLSTKCGLMFPSKLLVEDHSRQASLVGLMQERCGIKPPNSSTSVTTVAKPASATSTVIATTIWLLSWLLVVSIMILSSNRNYILLRFKRSRGQTME